MQSYMIYCNNIFQTKIGNIRMFDILKYINSDKLLIMLKTIASLTQDIVTIGTYTWETDIATVATHANQRHLHW